MLGKRILQNERETVELISSLRIWDVLLEKMLCGLVSLNICKMSL